MAETGPDTGRLGNLANNIVFIITLLAGMAAVYYGYIIGTGSIISEWQAHCSQFPDPVEYNNCMILSHKLMSHYKKLLFINLAIAFIVPALFWGGKRLYKKMSGAAAVLMAAASLVFFSGFFQPAACEEAEWKFFSESNTNRWYYNTKSITSDKNIVKVWGKGLAKNQKGIDEKIKLLKKFGGQTMGYENYSYTLNLFEIDCENKKQRIISVKDYDKKGSGLETATIENYPWDFIAPGTIIDNLYKEVCVKK